jgi:RNA polymerase sigma-70 factor, ECF subfamily
VEDRSGLDALVAAARSGDGGAWEALYRRAYPRLFAYARRRLASDDAAREAVSETMARAVRGVGRYRSEGAGFDAWLSGIVRHVVLDAQRAGSRRSARVAAVVAVPEVASSDAGPEELLLGSVEAAAVRAAFARLSPADQELLELRVVLGLSSDEAAAALGKRAGAVRMAQARALDRLRSLLADEAGVDDSAGDGAGGAQALEVGEVRRRA